MWRTVYYNRKSPEEGDCSEIQTEIVYNWPGSLTATLLLTQVTRMVLLLALLSVLICCTIIDAAGEGLPEVDGLRLAEQVVKSSVDGKPQPVVIGVPETLGQEATPLLVGIHTWSADYRQMVSHFAPLCARYGWLMVLPHFRGPNLDSNPCCTEASGSLLAQHDVVDAVHYMQANYPVDPARQYLIGGSGGGHMSLMMAGKHPELWAAVSAWCPVSHLREWYEQGNSYAPHIAACCGGRPGDSPEVDFEYLRRSPRTFLTNAANTRLQIAHGDKDPTIDVNQTWRTYSVLRPVPHCAEFFSWTGGHDLVEEWGFAWLASQVKPAAPPTVQHLVTDEGKWYFWLYLEPDAPLTLARCEARLEPAAAPTLCLKVEHSAVTRVQLSDLGVSALLHAQRNGQPLPPAEYRLRDGVLTLPPVTEPAEFTFTIGA